MRLFGYEFKDIIKEVHGIDKNANKIVIESKKINFEYQTNLPENLIITNLILQVIKGSKEKLKKKLTSLKKIKIMLSL